MNRSDETLAREWKPRSQEVSMENSQNPGSEAPLATTLELHVRFGDGRREVLPIRGASTEYRFPGGPTMRFVYQGGKIGFLDLEKSSLVYKEGQPLVSGLLEVGTTLDVGNHRVLLWDTGVPATFLKGCTAPFSNDLWPLSRGEHAIGRPGIRSNAISLDHPTVSRAHAKIIGKEDGSYQLLAEAVTNPVYLKGEALEPGRTVTLRHGDLMEVGELIFRFHQPSDGTLDTQDRACITVNSLGGLSVVVGGQEVPDKAWRTNQIRTLFARLALAWGRPLGTQALTEELWPGADPEKAKTNFRYSLSTLRQLLRGFLPLALQATDTVLRSSTTLQLNPDLLDRHDAVDLQRLVQATITGETWEQDAQRSVLSYHGPFLDGFRESWAVETRQWLQAQVLSLAKGLLARLEQRESWDDVVAVASHVQTIDPHAQWACLSLMRALRQSGRAQEALDAFEKSSKIWLEDRGVEADIELLQEQQLAISTLKT